MCPELGSGVMRAVLPPVPSDWLQAAARTVSREPGVRLEYKAHGFVLPYREAPAAGSRLQAALQAIVVDAHFEIMTAAMAAEARARGVDKGTALHQLMQQLPFAGRLPVFIGDDVTDLDAIRAVNTLGRAGLLVETWFTAPTNVRQWLKTAARTQEWPPFP